jgi:PAS domain S-box-containing protein
MDKKTKKKIPLRVLCLEDEPKDAELIHEILEEAGYKLKMDILETEKDFVSALKSKEYDVILADYKLPAFNAPAALRLSKELCPDIPFICVSGTMGEDVAVDLLKHGATDYVLKDRMGRLPSAVQRALHEAYSIKVGRQAEEALQESERKFRSLVENAFDSIYLMRGRRYEYVNPRFTELTGYTFEELTSEDFDFDKLLTDISRQVVNERYQDRVKGIEVPGQYETQIKTKDNRVLDVEISTVRMGSKNNVIVLGMIHDLTKRKQAELGLMKAHKILNETQALSKIGGWSYDVATKTGTWTDEVYNIFSVGKDYDIDDINSIIAFYTPEDLPVIEKAFLNAIENCVPFDLELELIKKTGKRIWVRTIGKPHIRDGKVVRVSGNIMDISERKQAEEELKALSSRQEAILSAVPDIIMEVDNDKVYTWANRAGIKFFGDDVIGKDASYYFEDETDVYGYVKPLFSGEEDTVYVENWQRRRDGEKRLLGWWCRVLKNGEGQIIGALSSARDITESRKTEEIIAHLNRVLLSIRDVNRVIINENDEETIIQRTCKILVERRGYSEVMIILIDNEGKPKYWSEAGLGDSFGSLEQNLKLGILPPCCDDALFEKDINFISDRSKICAECSVIDSFMANKAMCTRIRYNDKTYGYLSVSVEREQIIDDEEQSLFMELANDVAFALYNIELMQAKKRLEDDRSQIEAEYRQSQKMEAVGLLAGGVAHDFNNMLTIIIGYTDLALAKLSVDDPLYKNFVEIQAASQRSMNIIRQLLAFSRKQLIAPEAARLNEHIKEMLKMLSRLIGEDIELKFLPSEDLWNIWIDPSQISQILTNLAVNARDAIEDVGRVNIETANVVLDEAYIKIHKHVVPGEYVSLIFSDTGKGIKPDIIDHIFEPFFTTKEEGKGTGLGLPTVYGIVKQNNGYIYVYSESGMGTTFKIYFPRYHGEVKAPPEKSRTEVMEGTETVLVVEDYEEILCLAVEILEKYGYTVLKARNPNEAIMTSEQYKGDIHLLITDVVMPTMNGKDLEEKIKSSRPNIKTLFMSGYTADIIAQRGVIEQGVAFLQKPFTVQSFTIKVREVLDL